MTKQVGVLWVKTYIDEEGKEQRYWSGILDLGLLGTINIAVFKNNKKEEKHPDLRIVISNKKEKEKEPEEFSEEPF